MNENNIVILKGRVATEPVLREVNGQYVCNFRIKVTKKKLNKTTNEVKVITNFFSIICWENVAKYACEICKKGAYVDISAELSTFKPKPKDENDDPKSIIEIKALKIYRISQDEKESEVAE